MIVLLDSTVLIDVLRGRHNRHTVLADLVGAGHTLATTAINVGEVYGGMRPSEAIRTESLFSSLECYTVTAAIARRAGSFQRAWAQKGMTLTLADMIVAATAIERGAALMTSNRKDFPLSELNFLSIQ